MSSARWGGERLRDVEQPLGRLLAVLLWGGQGVRIRVEVIGFRARVRVRV